MKSFFSKGIGVIEILVVLAGIAVLTAIVIPRFSDIRENQVLKNAVIDILSSVNKARSQTLASVDSSSYGVHFQSDKVIIFKGVTFSPIDVNNEEVNIISPSNISDVTLDGMSGTSGDLYFSRIYGVPDVVGTITVSIPSSSRVITIYQSGNASVN